jgi:hypothetical protein
VSTMVTIPEYRTILAADLAGSAGRGDSALLCIREVLFTALREALERSEVDWAACICNDTGDGAQLIMPSKIRKAQLIHPLGYELAARLRAHNMRAAPPTQVQVRLALHAGDIHLDPEGTAVGPPLEVVARLLDAPPTREALARDGVTVPLAIIISQHFYDETVPHGYPGIERESFRRVAVAVKKYTADAWLWMPPTPETRAADSSLPSREARPAASALTPPGPGQITVGAGRDLSGTVIVGNNNTAHRWQALRRQP